MQYSRCRNIFAFDSALFFIFLCSAIAVLRGRVPLYAGLQKRANLSTPTVGLAGTEDQTRATCVAGSIDNRSAIHYDSKKPPCFNSGVKLRLLLNQRDIKFDLKTACIDELC
jgi:hypothetical protein